MIRAAKAAESQMHNRKPPPPPSINAPPNNPAAARSLSSLTGLPAKGSQQNPIPLDDTSKLAPQRVQPKSAEAVLAQARQRIGSAAGIDANKGELQLKRPSMKRPSLRNQSFAAARSTSARSTSTQNTSQHHKGSLSNIILSNKSTANYLSKNAPKLLKHYPKIEPNDYWKNLHSWDFIHELNAKVGESKAKSGKRKRGTGTTTTTTVESKQDTKNTIKQQPLPNTFASHREYCALWSPLLMIETRAQLLSDAISDIPYWRSKPEKQPIKVRVEVRKKDLDGEYDTIGLVVKCAVGDYAERTFMNNDVVVLVRDEKTIWDASKGSSMLIGCQPCCAVGHLEHTRRSIENLVINVSRKVWKQVGREEMTFLKVGCNITSLREFTALCRMDRLPLAEYILCNRMNVEEDADKKPAFVAAEGMIDPEKEKKAKTLILQKMGGPIALGKGFVDYAQHKFNLSQLEGISASAAEYGNGGFTLVSSHLLVFSSAQ